MTKEELIKLVDGWEVALKEFEGNERLTFTTRIRTAAIEMYGLLKIIDTYGILSTGTKTPHIFGPGMAGEIHKLIKRIDGEGE